MGTRGKEILSKASAAAKNTVVTEVIRKKQANLLILFCTAVYAVSYLTRVNYSAVLVEIIRSEGYSKSSASMALTALFITYGFGQVISGFLGDKLKPEKIIFFGLLLTAGMNILIPLTTDTAQMTAVWAVNGFAQALMWPPIVKILLNHLDAETYRKRIIIIGWGGHIGTFIVYLFSPVIINIFNWRVVFLVSAGIAVAMAIIWMLKIGQITDALNSELTLPSITESATQKDVAKEKMPPAAVIYLVFAMIAIVAQGLLRDGIMTWMPTYISEQFNISSSSSILTGLGLPIFSVIVSFAAAYIFRHCIKNESLCSAAFFAVCFVSNLILCFSYSSSPALSVALLTLVNGGTHGINIMYTCMAVQHYAKYGRPSLIAGLINSATYIGSALSIYGGAEVTNAFGWSGMMVTWCVAGAVGLAFSLGSVGLLNKIKNSEK